MQRDDLSNVENGPKTDYGGVRHIQLFLITIQIYVFLWPEANSLVRVEGIRSWGRLPNVIDADFSLPV